MSKVCVVTGGGSGMSFEAAKRISRDHVIVLMGRTPEKLENAVEEIKAIGGDGRAFSGDVSSESDVKGLREFAGSIGEVDMVIHGAGIAPSAADDAMKLIDINAIGTINIDSTFAEAMNGGCILNIASSSGYMLPPEHLPTQLYTLAGDSSDSFRTKMNVVLSKVPEGRRSGMAYCISKNFVIWFTRKMAVRYGKKGLRVVSISPGIIKTPLSDSEASSESLAAGCALGRMAEAGEIAVFMESILRDTYLTGVDVLYDGGLIAQMQNDQ